MGRQPRQEAPRSTKSKYGAVRTEVDGIVFHSRKEAQRYTELKCLEHAGKIFRLQLQPRYRLCAFVPPHRDSTDLPALGDYIADFRYCNVSGCLCAWGCTVEDVKGFKTPLYRWKKKHMEAQYGITIREI
jgi:hypothetical protein